ncbi:MAG TPA: hypothetical protein ENN74_03140, partial [Firmicutes bacterium]|nr:hypothetical protein [Bacillota bacterium]
MSIVLLAGVALAQEVDWHRSDSNNDGVVDHQDLYNLHKVWQVSGDPLSPADSVWSVVGNDIYRFEGNVGIGTSTPGEKLDVRGAIRSDDPAGQGTVTLFADPHGGIVEITNPSGGSAARLWTMPSGAGLLTLYDPEGYRQTSLFSGEYGGEIEILNQAGSRASYFWADAGGGYVDVQNADAQLAGSLWVTDAGGGTVTLYDGGVIALFPPGDEVLRVQLSANSDAVGDLWLYGPNTNPNVSLTATNDNSNHGAVTVYDSKGYARAQMYVDANGNGFVGPVSPKGTLSAGIGFDTSGRSTLWANQAYLIEDHPAEPDAKIVYSTLEGREAAIYCRGAVSLEAGRAIIELPEDFVALASPGTLTVQLTPGSLSSKGLAFETLGKGRIEIGELGGGTGSYPVHYLVHAERAGYENHKAVVSAEEFRRVFAAQAPVSAKPMAARRSSPA